MLLQGNCPQTGPDCHSCCVRKWTMAVCPEMVRPSLLRFSPPTPGMTTYSLLPVCMPCCDTHVASPGPPRSCARGPGSPNEKPEPHLESQRRAWRARDHGGVQVPTLCALPYMLSVLPFHPAFYFFIFILFSSSIPGLWGTVAGWWGEFRCREQLASRRILQEQLPLLHFKQNKTQTKNS